MKSKNIKIFFLVLLLLTGIIISSCAHEKANVPPSARAESSGGIKGKIVMPINNAYVYIYKDQDQIHGPGFAISEATSNDGDFSIDKLPPGKYYAVVRKRQNGEKSGPMTIGDYKSDVYGPIEIKTGEYVDREFSCYIKTDSSMISNLADKKTKTAISGIIRDSDGNPIAGIRVHIYTHVQMSERPKYVSDKTGHDGKYTIYLNEGGTFYLCARDRFGGPPIVGELYGRYDGGDINLIAVVVKDNEILENIDINVHKIW